MRNSIVIAGSIVIGLITFGVTSRLVRRAAMAQETPPPAVSRLSEVRPDLSNAKQQAVLAEINRRQIALYDPVDALMDVQPVGPMKGRGKVGFCGGTLIRGKPSLMRRDGAVVIGAQCVVTVPQGDTPTWKRLRIAVFDGCPTCLNKDVEPELVTEWIGEPFLVQPGEERNVTVPVPFALPPQEYGFRLDLEEMYGTFERAADPDTGQVRPVNVQPVEWRMCARNTQAITVW